MRGRHKAIGCNFLLQLSEHPIDIAGFGVRLDNGQMFERKAIAGATFG